MGNEGSSKVLADRHFRLFLISRATSWVGSAMTLVALPVLLYQRTGNAGLAGLLAALEALPYLVLGLPAGALVDRWNQRRTMLTTSILSAAVMASIPIAHWCHLLSTAHILVAAVSVSALFVFFDAANFGAVPALVGRQGVAAATSVMSSIYTVIGLLGPAVAGAAATGWGAANLIAVDAGSHIVAALLLRRVRWPESAEPAKPAGTFSAGFPEQLRRIRHDVAEGLSYIWSHRVIRTLTLLGAGSSVSSGAVSGLLIVVAVRQFGFADDDSRIGLLYAAAALGSLVTSLLLTRIQRRFRIGSITLGALALSWVALLWLSQSTIWTLGLVVLGVWQASNSLVTINGIVVRQAITPQRLQGRVNTTARTIAWGGSPLGAALGGVLAEAFGTGPALLVASSGILLALIIGLFGPLRKTGRLAELIAGSDEAQVIPDDEPIPAQHSSATESETVVPEPVRTAQPAAPDSKVTSPTVEVSKRP